LLEERQAQQAEHVYGGRLRSGPHCDRGVRHRFGGSAGLSAVKTVIMLHDGVHCPHREQHSGNNSEQRKPKPKSPRRRHDPAYGRDEGKIRWRRRRRLLICSSRYISRRRLSPFAVGSIKGSLTPLSRASLHLPKRSSLQASARQPQPTSQITPAISKSGNRIIGAPPCQSHKKFQRTHTTIRAAIIEATQKRNPPNDVGISVLP